MTSALPPPGSPVGADVLDPDARRVFDALFDPASGLPGRALLYDRLVVALARTRRSGTAVGVYFVRASRPIGEAALLEAGARLVDLLRADDTVARWAPTELVAACHLRDQQEAPVVARRIAKLFQTGWHSTTMTVAYAVGRANDDPGEVLHRAAHAPAGTVTGVLTPRREGRPRALRLAR